MHRIIKELSKPGLIVSRQSISCAMLSLAMALVLFTVQGKAYDDEFENGPISERRAIINKLIRLKMDDGKLVIKQDWQSSTFLQKQDEMDEKVNRLVQQQGMDAATAQTLVRKAMRSSRNSHPLTEAFNKIVGSDRAISGRTSNSSKHVRSEYSTNNILAKLRFTVPATIEMSFHEKTGPKRKCTVQQNDDFLFEYAGADFLIKLAQKPDKSIELILKNGDESNTYTGEDYEDLVNQHTDVIKNELLPIFHHIGIGIPLTSDSKLVKDAVRLRLIGIHGSSAREFKKLVAKLDSDYFEQREEANRILMDDLEKWRNQIEIELSKRLSPEVRYRLTALIKGNQSENEVDQIIKNQELLNSADYLTTLFDGANEQQTGAINRQLQQLTGHNVQGFKAWNEYLQNRGAN